MKTRTLFGIAWVAILHRLFGKRLTRNPQYQGIKSAGTKYL
ncbi:MAG: hypothetical protein WCJ25_02760 [Candidatus Moraniibacteriota bacterium]